MTNLEIIKYLTLNNPTRLAELLDDIYCNAWNCGSYAGSSGGKILEECEMEFTESGWLNQDADTGFFLDCELKEWSKVIDSPPTIAVDYGNLSVTFPVKDPDHMWNNNNEYDYEVNE